MFLGRSLFYDSFSFLNLFNFLTVFSAAISGFFLRFNESVIDLTKALPTTSPSPFFKDEIVFEKAVPAGDRFGKFPHLYGSLKVEKIKNSRCLWQLFLDFCSIFFEFCGPVFQHKKKKIP